MAVIPDIDHLRRFVPLDRLSPERLEELIPLCNIQHYHKGATIYWEGEQVEHTAFLFGGEILLTSFEDPRKYFIKASSDEAHLPLTDGKLHSFTVIALDEVDILEVDSDVMDYMSSWDHFVTSPDAKRISVRSTDPSRISNVKPLYKNGPYVDNKELLGAMETVRVKAGDTIIQQGDEGDYYYVMVKGAARVSRVVELAEIEAGSTFGEEALLTEEPRNASVTMTTDGILKRISKQDFDRLFKETLIRRLSCDEARQAINNGSTWLDVRSNEEYNESHLPNAVHIPVNQLRARMQELDPQGHYICYCKTGRYSTTAAFLLRQKGFDVAILDGGLQTLPRLMRMAS
jgi:CRP-like cAMP-binding protein